MVRQRKHFNKWSDFECTAFIFNFFLDTSFDSNRLAANEFSDKIICKWFIFLYKYCECYYFQMLQ